MSLTETLKALYPRSVEQKAAASRLVLVTCENITALGDPSHFTV
jgi:hypothetical protein